MKLFIATAGLVALVAAAPGDGGRLHTADDPKMMIFSGAEVADIKNWEDARQYCKHNAGDRILASQSELCCKFRNENVAKREPYIGRQPSSQWMPARAKDQNEWVQVGESNEAEMCQSYRSANGIPFPSDAIAASEGPYVSPCKKPDGCIGSKCAMTCTEKEAFYPDPTDCKAYCYCSGANDMSSFWERIEDPDLIWDPFCADSTHLDKNNKPLG